MHVRLGALAIIVAHNEVANIIQKCLLYSK
jgi:hypothetical protein